MIELISSDDLARSAGYDRATSAFREWCASLRITPVPGRRGYYDPVLVRRRLDEAQGLQSPQQAVSGASAGLVAQRRARRGAD